MTIDVKQAVQNAVTALTGFYAGQVLTGVQLEEVELADDEKSWFITLGFYRQEALPPSASNVIASLMPEYRRQYKVFKVDTETGKVISMKIRLIPA